MEKALEAEVVKDDANERKNTIDYASVVETMMTTWNNILPSQLLYSW